MSSIDIAYGKKSMLEMSNLFKFESCVLIARITSLDIELHLFIVIALKLRSCIIA